MTIHYIRQDYFISHAVRIWEKAWAFGITSWRLTDKAHKKVHVSGTCSVRNLVYKQYTSKRWICIRDTDVGLAQISVYPTCPEGIEWSFQPLFSILRDLQRIPRNHHAPLLWYSAVNELPIWSTRVFISTAHEFFLLTLVSLTMESRALYGGAISCTVAKTFLDAR